MARARPPGAFGRFASVLVTSEGSTLYKPAASAQTDSNFYVDTVLARIYPTHGKTFFRGNSFTLSAVETMSNRHSQLQLRLTAKMKPELSYTPLFGNLHPS